MIGMRLKAAGALAGAMAALAATGPASAQTKGALTAAEIEAALVEAGLSPQMTEDSATGAPVARGSAGDITFWVRAMDCKGQPAACETLIFFANFELGRTATPGDFRIINRFNDRQVFGRAYVLEAQRQIGVDYVIELDGGVTQTHLARNVERWSDVIIAFIENFRAGEPGAS